MIEEYTREAGLRNLEREIGSCCRKVAVRIASGDARAVKMTPALVRALLGVPKFRSDEALSRNEIGAATGLGGGSYVVAGAFVLVGLPELLREFVEFRLLIYLSLMHISEPTRPY